MEKLEKIKNNLFINDTDWYKRAMENEGLAKQIRDDIMLGKITDRKQIVEILDFLDYHNL